MSIYVSSPVPRSHLPAEHNDDSMQTSQPELSVQLMCEDIIGHLLPPG